MQMKKYRVVQKKQPNQKKRFSTFFSVMLDNTPIKIPTKNIRVADSLRGSNCFFTEISVIHIGKGKMKII